MLIAWDLTNCLFSSTWVIRNTLKSSSVVENYTVGTIKVTSSWERKLKLRICRKVISDVVVKSAYSCWNIKFKSYGTAIWAQCPVRILSWIKVCSDRLTGIVYICWKSVGNNDRAIRTMILVESKIKDDISCFVIRKCI